MGSPNGLVVFAQVAFIALTLLAFAQLGARRGMLMAMFGGWLFLPTFHFKSILPLLNSKAMFAPAVVLGVSMAMDMARWRTFRPQTLDLVVLLMCGVPFVSAINNGAGAYEGTSAMFEAATVWGAPYLLGRLYLRDEHGPRDLAVTFVSSALVYLPLCLWEMRMSPQLHFKLYGFYPFDFIQSMRSGGYRPSVFMQHGLMAALFMACATLCAYWLWRTKAVRTLGGLRMGVICGALVVLMALFRSTGALILLFTAVGTFEATRRSRSAIFVVVLLLLPPSYWVARASGWSGETLVEWSAKVTNRERADSLHYRIRMENLLIQRALVQPSFGWGRSGGARVVDESGKDLTVTDGFWIIVLGNNGWMGLLAYGLLMGIPVLLLLRRLPVRSWADPRVAPAAALAMMLLLTHIDNLFNAMLMPMFPLAAGTLVSLSLEARFTRRRPRAARVARAPLPGGSPQGTGVGAGVGASSASPAASAPTPVVRSG